MTQNKKKSSKNPSSLDRQIDENLRRVYDDTLKEELPERFLDLIAQLKDGSGQASNGH
ncbi:MAG: NepR family anti-sigma factor [Pseudomonadota bacterium]